MQIKYAVLILSLVLPVAFANAMYLQIEGPINATLQQNGAINLGKIGPGESFYILASANTTNASGVLINKGWDTLEPVSLPAGWVAQASPLYENPMKIKITTASFTPNGTYTMTIRAVNVGNYSKLGNLTITAYINVSTNVFTASVSPTNLTVGVGQPGDLNITINNTGASDDPFLINVTGLPAWNNPVEVIAPHDKVSHFIYQVSSNEPGQYPFNVTINSTTSALLHTTFKIRLAVQESVLSDYNATGQGLLLSPVIYEPVYALMQFLNYVYNLIAGV
jgi:hypothetical protein